MRTSALACAVLAGTLGFSSIAVAQDGNRHRGDRGDRWEQRQDRREAREDRRDVRRDDRRDRQAWHQDRRAPHARPHAGRPDAPRHVYQAPRYVYQAPRFHRGGYLPHEYRSRGYYVSNWNAYPRLYAPPHGYQWMNVNGDFLLVALATGLIANALIN